MRGSHHHYLQKYNYLRIEYSNIAYFEAVDDTQVWELKLKDDSCFYCFYLTDSYHYILDNLNRNIDFELFKFRCFIPVQLHKYNGNWNKQFVVRPPKSEFFIPSDQFPVDSAVGLQRGCMDSFTFNHNLRIDQQKIISFVKFPDDNFFILPMIGFGDKNGIENSLVDIIIKIADLDKITMLETVLNNNLTYDIATGFGGNYILGSVPADLEFDQEYNKLFSNSLSYSRLNDDNEELLISVN